MTSMATVANQLHMSLAEFLDWDDGTDTLYELVEGRIVAMAPPNDAHGTIIMNIGLAIGPALKAPCNAGIVLPSGMIATTSPISPSPATSRPASAAFCPSPG
jgi:Putative restriction endonuclease